MERLLFTLRATLLPYTRHSLRSRARRSTRARSLYGLLLAAEVLPELDAVTFRIEEADKLALPFRVCSDLHRRRVHAVLVQASDDCVDIVDPIVDDVTLARVARVAGHDREHEVLALVGMIELAVVQLDVVGAFVGEVSEFPTEMAPVPLRQRAWIARKQKDTADHQCVCHRSLARVLLLRREGDIEITGVHVSDGDRSVDRGIRVRGRQPGPVAADMACVRTRAGSERHRPIEGASEDDDQAEAAVVFRETAFSGDRIQP